MIAGPGFDQRPGPRLRDIRLLGLDDRPGPHSDSHEPLPLPNTGLLQVAREGDSVEQGYSGWLADRSRACDRDNLGLLSSQTFRNTRLRASPLSTAWNTS